MPKKGIKYVFSSVSAWAVDNGLYWVLIQLIGMELSPLAQAIARVASSLYNFNMNKFFVFRSTDNYWKDFLRYYCLCIPQALVSMFILTVLIGRMNITSTTLALAVKLVIEAVIFVLSYVIQNKWVFKSKTEDEEKTDE